MSQAQSFETDFRRAQFQNDEMILDRFDHIFRLRDGRLETEAPVGPHLETAAAY